MFTPTSCPSLSSYPPMSCPSNALTVGSRSRPDASAPPGNATGAAVRQPPDILTYCHNSRMVYVTPGETYDVCFFLTSPTPRLPLLIESLIHLQNAIEIAVESFPELKDVERDRICLEVRVVLSNQHERRTAEIGRSAWSVVVNTLARFEIIEIRVATPPKSTSGSIVEPPPYASEHGWYSDTKGSQSNPLAYRQQFLSPLSQPQSNSFTSRVVDLFSPGSSRGRLSPQPCHRHRC